MLNEYGDDLQDTPAVMIIGEDVTEDGVPSKDMHAKQSRAYEQFLDAEKDITNNVVFWTILGILFPSTEWNCLVHDELIEAFKRYDRLEVPLAERKSLCTWFYERQHPLIPSIGKNIFTELGEMPDDGLVTIYRGFMCRKDLDKRIRQSDEKGTVEYQTQDEGVGLSYTLDREIAAKFSLRKTDYTTVRTFWDAFLQGDMPNDGARFFGGAVRRMSQKERKERVEEVGIDFSKDTVAEVLEKLDQHKDNEFVKGLFSALKTGFGYREDFAKSKLEIPDADTYAGFGVRPVIATYTVIKSDIVTVFRGSEEAEVVALPNDIELKRYDFLTSSEIHRTVQLDYYNPLLNNP